MMQTRVNSLLRIPAGLKNLRRVKMDTDMKILKILEDDARIPSSEIATMLDSDEKTVNERIKKLRRRGVIRKFKTSINWRKVGRHIVTAIIQVKVIPRERSGFDKICKEISRDDRIKDLFVATGEYDLILLVEGDDIDDISKFVTEKLTPKKEVVGTYTHIILREYKRDGVVSFDDRAERLKISL